MAFDHLAVAPTFKWLYMWPDTDTAERAPLRIRRTIRSLSLTAIESEYAKAMSLCDRGACTLDPLDCL